MVFACPPTYINIWWKSTNQPTNHRSGGDIGHRFFRVSSGFTTGTQLVNIALQHLPVGRDFSLQDMGVGLWASDEVTDACLKRFFYKKKPSLEQTGSLSLDQMDQRQPKHWWQLKWAATCVVYLLMSSFSFSWPHFSAYSRHVQTKGTSMFSRRFLFLFLFLIDPLINCLIWTNKSARARQGNPTDSTIEACGLVRQGDSAHSTLVPELRVLAIRGVCSHSRRQQTRKIRTEQNTNFVVPLSWCQHKAPTVCGLIVLSQSSTSFGR